jgi:hypothetical protein
MMANHLPCGWPNRACTDRALKYLNSRTSVSNEIRSAEYPVFGVQESDMVMMGSIHSLAGDAALFPPKHT